LKPGLIKTQETTKRQHKKQVLLEN